MIIGIGIDIIELTRIERLIEQPKFLERILTEREREAVSHLKGHRKVEFVAGRFAAKEAYSKAAGSGIGGELSFLDIEILNNEKGKPVIFVQDTHMVHVSISHSKQFAVAQVIIESSSR